MKSTGDPILDTQSICTAKPSTSEEIGEGLKALGWGMPLDVILRMAEGTYIVKGPDGLYRHRAGTVREVVEKTLREKP